MSLNPENLIVVGLWLPYMIWWYKKLPAVGKVALKKLENPTYGVGRPLQFFLWGTAMAIGIAAPIFIAYRLGVTPLEPC